VHQGSNTDGVNYVKKRKEERRETRKMGEGRKSRSSCVPI